MDYRSAPAASVARGRRVTKSARSLHLTVIPACSPSSDSTLLPLNSTEERRTFFYRTTCRARASCDAAVRPGRRREKVAIVLPVKAGEAISRVGGNELRDPSPSRMVRHLNPAEPAPGRDPGHRG